MGKNKFLNIISSNFAKIIKILQIILCIVFGITMLISFIYSVVAILTENIFWDLDYSDILDTTFGYAAFLGTLMDVFGFSFNSRCLAGQNCIIDHDIMSFSCAMAFIIYMLIKGLLWLIILDFISKVYYASSKVIKEENAPLNNDAQKNNDEITNVNIKEDIIMDNNVNIKEDIIMENTSEEFKNDDKIVDEFKKVQQSKNSREEIRMYMMQYQNKIPQEKIPFLQRSLEKANVDLNQLNYVSMKDPTTTLILSIFLGALGVDRFYVGDIGLGICKLLFGWITFGIWPIVDIFLSYKKAKEVNYDNIIRALE